MKPITFQCSRAIPKSGEQICAEFADMARWSEFNGYGMLPGIDHAEYETRTDDMVGSRIRVHSSDGSVYIEEIYKWVDGKAIGIKFHEFTPPLSKLATHFTEEWDLQADDGKTLVSRHFQMFPSHTLSRPLLWLISLFFKRAIDRHLAEMATVTN